MLQMKRFKSIAFARLDSVESDEGGVVRVESETVVFQQWPIISQGPHYRETFLLV
jgi:hypothetical protein